MIRVLLRHSSNIFFAICFAIPTSKTPAQPVVATLILCQRLDVHLHLTLTTPDAVPGTVAMLRVLLFSLPLCCAVQCRYPLIAIPSLLSAVHVAARPSQCSRPPPLYY